jgi:hypothetical protein
MVRNFKRQSENAVEQSNAERFTVADDLEEPDLVSADRYFPIFRVEGTRTQHFAPGYGFQNENLARGWGDLDLQNGGGSAIQGKLRFALYSDSELDDPLFYGDTYTLSDLRAAVSEARTDKALFPGRMPFGSNDRVLVVEVSPNASSAGDTVDASNSTDGLGIPYSKRRV